MSHKLDKEYYVSCQPAAKRQKISNQIETENCSIFNVISIRNQILDYLPLQSNVSSIIAIANDNYLKKRLGLIKYDAMRVCNVIDLNKFYFKNICSLFSNFKTIFGAEIFDQILEVNLTINGFENNHNRNCLKIYDCAMIRKYDENEDDETEEEPINASYKVYFGKVIIKLSKVIDITHIFNETQQTFIENNQINLQNLTEFTFQISGSGTEDDITYEILPKYLYPMIESSFNSSFCLLGITVNPTVIEMIPKWLHFNNNQFELHTKSLLTEIRRVLFIPHPNSDINTNQEFALFIDHNVKSSHLNQLGIISESQLDFTINIHCDLDLQSTFTIENLSTNGNIKWHNIENLIRFTKQEMKFIRDCKRSDIDFVFDADDISFGEQIFRNGLLNIQIFGDVYYFEMNTDSQFMCKGASIFELSHNHEFPNSIKTSNIPKHWRLVEFGGTFNRLRMIIDAGNVYDAKVDISIDGFSENIQSFSITKKNISVSSGLQWNIIPKQMKWIRFPYDEYGYIAHELCTFMCDPPSFHPEVNEYKSIEIRFPEILFDENHDHEIYEQELGKMLNPAFSTKFDGEIVVYQKDIKNKNCF